MSKVLYEVTFEWHGIYFGAAFVFIITLIFFLRLRKKRHELDTRMQVAWFFSGMIAAGALIAQIIIGISAVSDYQQVVVAYQEGHYETVVGEVENFTTMTPKGKGYETFEVGGVQFSYSDNIIQQGYHNARIFGGVVEGEGQVLRIGYIEKDGKNIIVYIEEIGSQ